MIEAVVAPQVEEIEYEDVPYDELEVGKVYRSAWGEEAAWVVVVESGEAYAKLNGCPHHWVFYMHLDGKFKGQKFVKTRRYYYQSNLLRPKVKKSILTGVDG